LLRAMHITHELCRSDYVGILTESRAFYNLTTFSLLLSIEAVSRIIFRIYTLRLIQLPQELHFGLEELAYSSLGNENQLTDAD
jgi:hypothetical protein